MAAVPTGVLCPAAWTVEGGIGMAGKVVLKKSGDQYVFSLKAGNGEIVATSERNTTKAAAKNGIESVRRNAPAATLSDETGE